MNWKLGGIKMGKIEYEKKELKKPNWFLRQIHQYCEVCWNELHLKKTSGWYDWKARCSNCGIKYTFSKGMQY